MFPALELPDYLKVADVMTAMPTMAAPVDPKVQLQARFDRYKDMLRTNGVYAGTYHKRIFIPKSKITEDDLHTLGFEPVLAAIPEAGQDRFQSFRHPDNLFHIHSHNDNWTMHEDEHPSSTMLARKIGRIPAAIQGIPHIITEGIPGLYAYAKGALKGHKSTFDNVSNELSPEVRSFLSSKEAQEERAKRAAFEFGAKLAELTTEQEQQPSFLRRNAVPLAALAAMAVPVAYHYMSGQPVTPAAPGGTSSMASAWGGLDDPSRQFHFNAQNHKVNL